MLTEDDLKIFIAAMDALLETKLEAYGLKKPKVLKSEQAAIRMRAYRKRHASSVTQSVTERNGERNAPHREKRNGQRNGSEHPRNGELAVVEVPITRQTWNAYSAAYQDRYRVAPKWNARVGGLLKGFVGRLGAEESPLVAAFYLTHEGRYYVQQCHSVQAMVKDAEKLRTEWATNRTITETQARQGDQTAALGNVFRELKDEIKHH